MNNTATAAALPQIVNPPTIPDVYDSEGMRLSGHDWIGGDGVRETDRITIEDAVKFFDELNEQIHMHPLTVNGYSNGYQQFVRHSPDGGPTSWIGNPVSGRYNPPDTGFYTQQLYDALSNVVELEALACLSYCAGLHQLIQFKVNLPGDEYDPHVNTISYLTGLGAQSSNKFGANNYRLACGNAHKRLLESFSRGRGAHNINSSFSVMNTANSSDRMAIKTEEFVRMIEGHQIDVEFRAMLADIRVDDQAFSAIIENEFGERPEDSGLSQTRYDGRVSLAQRIWNSDGYSYLGELGGTALGAFNCLTALDQHHPRNKPRGGVSVTERSYFANFVETDKAQKTQSDMAKSILSAVPAVQNRVDQVLAAA